MKTAQIIKIEHLKGEKGPYGKLTLAGVQGARYTSGDDYAAVKDAEGRTITYDEKGTIISNIGFTSQELRKEVTTIFGNKDVSIVAQVCVKVAGEIMANQKEYDGVKLIEIAKDVAEGYKQVVKILAENA